VFVDDVGLLREEVIKIQVKVALGSTSILLCAIKSSLLAGKGELIGGRCNSKHLVYGGENYITNARDTSIFSQRKYLFHVRVKGNSSHYDLQEYCSKIGENGPDLSA
jgi:hypothetical protein